MTVELSPEQKRIRALPRKKVFTIAMAPAESRRKFIVGQRLVFSLAVIIGLGAMWVGSQIPKDTSLALRWPILAAAAALFSLSISYRLRRRTGQIITFFLSLVAAGLGISSFANPDTSIAFLVNPSILVGLTILGFTINTILIKRELSAWVEFLLTGPWLALACLAAYFFPAGEWIMLGSGLAACLLLYCMHRAAREHLRYYQPGETWTSAADVIPAVVIGGYRKLSGRD